MSSKHPIDFQAEENELYDICTPATVAIYKWFDLIRVELGDGPYCVVEFGKSFLEEEVPKEVGQQIRSYVKEQKRTIRENPRGYSAEEGRRKIFWLLTMFIEHGVFSKSIGKLQTYTTFSYCQTREDGY